MENKITFSLGSLVKHKDDKRSLGTIFAIVQTNVFFVFWYDLYRYGRVAAENIVLVKHEQ